MGVLVAPFGVLVAVVALVVDVDAVDEVGDSEPLAYVLDAGVHGFVLVVVPVVP